MPTASESPTKPPPALLSFTKGESLIFFLFSVFFPQVRLFFFVSVCFFSVVSSLSSHTFSYRGLR